jgi:hypothetical protein
MIVMPGHSRSKNGVASLAYVPGIYAFAALPAKGRGWRDKPGHDERKEIPLAFNPTGKALAVRAHDLKQRVAIALQFLVADAGH